MKLTNLLLFVAVFNVFGQRVITGVVTDGSRNSVPGVNITVPGTTVGTISDMDGKYTISVPAGSTTLTFSFIGMESQDVAIGNQTTINVTMRDATIGLGEVVVVGYGTTVKSNITGAISVVSTDHLQTFSGSTNIIDAMQASVSGAFVVQNDGTPGSLSNIYLRGPVSVNTSNPLYVVDGIPMKNFGYNFNPDDIESMTVLKDASAAAIYGAQAAAGVILVTTKRGSKDSAIRIRANSSIGFRKALFMPEVLQRDDYLKAREIFGTAVETVYGSRDKWSSLPNTMWLDEVMHTGSEQNVGVSMSGGNNISSFFASAGYNRVNGIALNNWIQRYTLRFNSDHQLLKNLRFSNNIFFNNRNENPSAGAFTSAIFRQNPILPVYDETALDNNGYAKVAYGFQGNNRVQQVLDRTDLNQLNQLTLNGTLAYDIIKGLKLSVFGGTTLGFEDFYTFVQKYNNGAFSSPSTVSTRTEKNQSFIVTYQLNYVKKIDKHTISALAGYEARKATYHLVGYSNSQGMLVDDPKHSQLVLSATAGQGNFSITDVNDRILSQFGRLEYDYAGKYLFTGNIRRDGYGSKFAPDYKYGVFPGASVGWNISREDFFNIPAFDLLKVRAGYGTLGNAVGGDFGYSSFYQVGYAGEWTTGNTSTKDVGIQIADRLTNPEIRWETVTTTEIGLDGVLWRGRFAFNLGYYSRQTKDMLYNIPVPRSAGVGGNVQANVGQMSNKGIDAYLEYKNKFGDFDVTVGVTLGYNKNKLITIAKEMERLYITSGSTVQGGESGGLGMQGTPSRSVPGQPLGQFWGYKANGIFQTQAEADACGYTVNISSTPYKPRVGDIRYVDLTGDGRITTADQTFIGNPWPKLTHGLTLGVGWKKIVDIKAVLGGTLGNDILNCTAPFQHQFFADYTTSPMIFDVSFFGDNGLTDKPRNGYINNTFKHGFDSNGNWTQISSWHVSKGSYIQLKTLTIGFSLPKNYASKLGVSNAKLTLSGENLGLLTKYKGLTPIIAPQGRNILAQGIETLSGRYPLSRLYSIGLNIDF